MIKLPHGAGSTGIVVEGHKDDFQTDATMTGYIQSQNQSDGISQDKERRKRNIDSQVLIVPRTLGFNGQIFNFVAMILLLVLFISKSLDSIDVGKNVGNVAGGSRAGCLTDGYHLLPATD